MTVPASTSRLPDAAKRRPQPRIAAAERTSFLEALAAGWSVKHAAERAGRDRRRFYDLRDADEAFAAEWNEAVEQGTELLEDELRRRAVDGWDENHFNGEGELIRRVHRISSQDIQFLLKARKPERFRENTRVELTGLPAQPILLNDRSASLVDVARVLREAGAFDALERQGLEIYEGEAVEVPDETPELPAGAANTEGDE
jgi:hypothetical protein